MQSSTDLERLRAMIEVPPGVAGARWVVHTLGDGGDSFLPGPTDYRLLALIRPADDAGWRALEDALGGPAGERTVIMPAEAAQALLGQAAPEPGEVSLKGQGYDAAALSSAQFRVDSALRVGDGVLVSAVSS